MSFISVLFTCISFGLGYCLKARFEINQENLIADLKYYIQSQKEEHHAFVNKLKSELSQIEKRNTILERNFKAFKEEVKNNRFHQIESHPNDVNQTTKALQQFL